MLLSRLFHKFEIIPNSRKSRLASELAEPNAEVTQVPVRHLSGLRQEHLETFERRSPREHQVRACYLSVGQEAAAPVHGGSRKGWAGGGVGRPSRLTALGSERGGVCLGPAVGGTSHPVGGTVLADTAPVTVCPCLSERGAT